MRLVVFDLDGTLVDSAADLAASVNAALAAHGERRLPSETIEGFIGDGARMLVARGLNAVSPRAGEGRLDLVFASFLDHYRVHCLDRTTLYPGVAEVLAELHRRGIALAVLTNKPRGFSEAILRGLGVRDLFSGLVGGDDLPTRKPDPEGLLRLVAAAGCRKDEVLLVGDLAVDVATARNAGVGACGVSWGFAASADLRAAGAAVVVDRPAAILERL